MSDPETCNEPGGFGLLLCARKKCIAMRDALPVADRIELYSALQV